MGHEYGYSDMAEFIEYGKCIFYSHLYINIAALLSLEILSLNGDSHFVELVRYYCG